MCRTRVRSARHPGRYATGCNHPLAFVFFSFVVFYFLSATYCKPCDMAALFFFILRPVGKNTALSAPHFRVFCNLVMCQFSSIICFVFRVFVSVVPNTDQPRIPHSEYRDAARCFFPPVFPAQFRNEDSQEALAELASSPSMHLAASIDHVNAPLLWDFRLVAKFNWVR